jgi:hypothetical protein
MREENEVYRDYVRIECEWRWAKPNTCCTELLDIPQSLELWARYFIIKNLSGFQEKRWTDVSMKDASFVVMGTALILEFNAIKI